MRHLLDMSDISKYVKWHYSRFSSYFEEEDCAKQVNPPLHDMHIVFVF